VQTRRLLTHACLALALLVLHARHASAQDAGPPADATPAEPTAAPAEPTAAPAEPTADAAPATPTAASVADAPLPHQASGLTVTPQPAQGWKVVPRTILLPFRVAARYLVIAPLEFGLYGWEKYQLGARIKNIFWNDEGTVGLYPLLNYESGFGVNVGARLVLRDLLERKEQLSLRASYGGEYRQLYVARFSSGKLLGDHVRFSLEGAHEVKPEEPFYGIGRDAPDRLTEYSATISWAQLNVQVPLGGGFTANLNTRLSTTDFGLPEDAYDDDDDGPFDDDDDDAPTEDVFDTAMLPGYDSGLHNVYSELVLAWQHFGYARPEISRVQPSSGIRLEGYLGVAHGFGDDPSDYWRHGVEVSGRIDLYRGDRLLVPRLLVEGVSGEREDVPFSNLPMLGGPYLLRGYARGRFRDRWMTLASLEYRYPINDTLLGALFVDVGNVWRSLDEVAPEDLRTGFGAGIELFARTATRGRVEVAFSPDGDVFLNLRVDPVTSLLSRTERK
jgi:hypothetical protein